MAAAAFYDLEGTLVSTNLVHTLGFYARNQQGLMRSLRKSASTLASIPVFAVADSYSRMVFNNIFASCGKAGIVLINETSQADGNVYASMPDDFLGFLTLETIKG